MNLQTIGRTYGSQVCPKPVITSAALDRRWYAVFTVPQHEKSVVKHLNIREIESFLPAYEKIQIWKNRQRMKVILPLFPSYLFVHIKFLRSDFCRQRIEPYRDFVIGEKVRIKSGVMQGLQGTLVRKSNSMRFVLTLELINQHAAIQVDAEDLEPIAA